MLKDWAYCTLIVMAFSGIVTGESVIELSAAGSPNTDLLSSADEWDPVALQPEDSVVASGTAIAPNNATNLGARLGKGFQVVEGLDISHIDMPAGPDQISITGDSFNAHANVSGVIGFEPPEIANPVSSLVFLGMSRRWISVVSVALFFTLTTVVAIFLIARAPVIESDDPRRYRVDGPRPTRLGRESESKRHRSGRQQKTRRKDRERAGAVIANLDFTRNEQSETIEDAARHLVSSLTEAEHDLLRDASGDMLAVGIKMGIRQNWQVCNQNSPVFLDAVDNYEAYDADAVCVVIIETAQELLLLSVESGGDR